VHLVGDRAEIRSRAAQGALELIRRAADPQTADGG
jgi:hypothetical protein